MLSRRVDLLPRELCATIAFLRAWCLVEVMTAIDSPGLAIVMKVGNMRQRRSGFSFKSNPLMAIAIGNIIDITQARATMADDLVMVRKLVNGRPGGAEALNTAVRSAITAGLMCTFEPAVQAAACGDRGALPSSAFSIFVSQTFRPQRRLMTEWLTAAAGSGYVSIMSDLLERGAKPAAFNYGGMSPLIAAAQAGQPLALRLLLEQAINNQVR